MQQTYRDLVGPPAAVQARVAELESAGRLLALTPPRGHPDGCRVRVWLRATSPQRQSAPAGVGQLLATLPRTPVREPRRDVVGRLGAVTGLALLATAALWLVWRAATAAVAWTQDHTGELGAAFGLAITVGILWAGRRLGRRPARPHHCPGCPHH